LAEVGLEPERLEMFNMGASDATKFTAAVEEMTKRAKELGPSPLRKGGVVQKEAIS
jgi:F420-non-reducing hydrogenase iron-sulfur subunit